MSIQIGSLTLKSRVYVPPMAGVTDIVFRHLVREVDRHCLLATEMVSSRALASRPDVRIMDLDKEEHPVGIQIFGHEPELMAQAALLAEEKGADFVDINMGCPVPKITKGKDGCALMKEPALAKEIITAVASAISIPLTVKIRLGWDDDSRNACEFGQMAEKAGAKALTVHGRTRQQFYSGRADWSFIGNIKKAVSIPVFGNGDVFEPQDALKLWETTGCDGVAVARGTLGNPWLISHISSYMDTGVLPEKPEPAERLITAYKHCLGLVAYKGERIGINESRRHLANYTKGIADSHSFRARLTQATSTWQAKEILTELALQVAGLDGKMRFLEGTELLARQFTLLTNNVGSRREI